MRARLAFPDNLTRLSREELLYALSSIDWTEEDKKRITKALAIKDLELCDRRIHQAEIELAAVAEIRHQLRSMNDSEGIRSAKDRANRNIDLIKKRIHRYNARKETIRNEFDI